MQDIRKLYELAYFLIKKNNKCSILRRMTPNYVLQIITLKYRNHYLRDKCILKKESKTFEKYNNSHDNRIKINHFNPLFK